MKSHASSKANETSFSPVVHIKGLHLGHLSALEHLQSLRVPPNMIQAAVQAAKDGNESAYKAREGAVLLYISNEWNKSTEDAILIANGASPFQEC